MLTFHSKLGSGRTLLVVVVSVVVVVVVVMKTLLVAMIRFSFSVFDSLVEKEWYRLCFRQNHRKVVFMRKSRLNGLPRERTEDDKRIIVKLKKKTIYTIRNVLIKRVWMKVISNGPSWKCYKKITLFAGIVYIRKFMSYCLFLPIIWKINNQFVNFGYCSWTAGAKLVFSGRR